MSVLLLISVSKAVIPATRVAITAKREIGIGGVNFPRIEYAPGLADMLAAVVKRGIGGGDVCRERTQRPQRDASARIEGTIVLRKG